MASWRNIFPLTTCNTVLKLNWPDYKGVQHKQQINTLLQTQGIILNNLGGFHFVVVVADDDYGLIPSCGRQYHYGLIGVCLRHFLINLYLGCISMSTLSTYKHIVSVPVTKIKRNIYAKFIFFTFSILLAGITPLKFILKIPPLLHLLDILLPVIMF